MSDQLRTCPNLARALACLFKDMLFDESPEKYPKRQRNPNSKNLTLTSNVQPIKYLTFICKKAIHGLKKQERTMENISSILLGEQHEFTKTLKRLGMIYSEIDFSFLANAQYLTRQFFYSMFSKDLQTRQKYWKTYQNQKEKKDKQKLVNLKIFINQYLFDQIKLSWNTKTERFSYKRFFKQRQTKIQKCSESLSSTGFEFNQQNNSNPIMKLIQGQQNEQKIQDEFFFLFYTKKSLQIQVQQNLNCSRGYEQQQSFSSTPENNIQLNISVCSGKEWFLEPQFCPQAWKNLQLYS